MFVLLSSLSTQRREATLETKGARSRNVGLGSCVFSDVCVVVHAGLCGLSRYELDYAGKRG